jgi:hypothetical protein
MNEFVYLNRMHKLPVCLPDEILCKIDNFIEPETVRTEDLSTDNNVHIKELRRVAYEELSNGQLKEIYYRFDRSQPVSVSYRYFGLSPKYDQGIKRVRYLKKDCLDFDRYRDVRRPFMRLRKKFRRLRRNRRSITSQLTPKRLFTDVTSEGTCVVEDDAA